MGARECAFSFGSTRDRRLPLTLLGLAGAMQAAIWAVPLVAVLIIFLCVLS